MSSATMSSAAAALAGAPQAAPAARPGPSGTNGVSLYETVANGEAETDMAELDPTAPETGASAADDPSTDLAAAPEPDRDATADGSIASDIGKDDAQADAAPVSVPVTAVAQAAAPTEPQDVAVRAVPVDRAGAAPTALGPAAPAAETLKTPTAPAATAPPPPTANASTAATADAPAAAVAPASPTAAGRGEAQVKPSTPPHPTATTAAAAAPPASVTPTAAPSAVTPTAGEATDATAPVLETSPRRPATPQAPAIVDVARPSEATEADRRAAPTPAVESPIRHALAAPTSNHPAAAEPPTAKNAPTTGTAQIPVRDIPVPAPDAHQAAADEDRVPTREADAAVRPAAAIAPASSDPAAAKAASEAATLPPQADARAAAGQNSRRAEQSNNSDAAAGLAAAPNDDAPVEQAGPTSDLAADRTSSALAAATEAVDAPPPTATNGKPSPAVEIEGEAPTRADAPGGATAQPAAAGGDDRPPALIQLAARRFQASLSHQTPAAQVAFSIAQGLADAPDRIRMQMYPRELGEVEILLDVQDNRRADVIVRAERPETMELLQKDARELQRALQAAGLDVNDNDLSFELGGRHGDPEGRDGAHDDARSGDAEDDNLPIDRFQPPAAPKWRVMTPGGVDLVA